MDDPGSVDDPFCYTARMFRSPTLIALTLAAALLGAGCAKPPAAAVEAGPLPEFIPRQDAKAPKDAWGEYQRAEISGALQSQSTRDEGGGPFVTLDIQQSWNGTGGLWRPSEADKLNYIRAAYLSGMGPETQWTNDQELAEYDVVHADKDDGRYALLMNHRGIKTSVLKVFTPDPRHPGSGFFLVECRVAYDAPDRAALWNACRAAVTSAKYETGE